MSYSSTTSKTTTTAYSRFIATYGNKIKRAWITPGGGGNNIYLQTTQPDLITNKSRNALTYLLSSSSTSTFVTPPQELNASIVAHGPSPSFRKWAYLLSEGNNDKDKTLKIEIWESSKGLTHSVKVDDVHGSFVTGEQFGGLSWSQNENILAYIADVKTLPSEAHELSEDWGEQMNGVRFPTCVLFSLLSSRAILLVQPPITQSPQQPPQPKPYDDKNLTDNTAYSQLLQKLQQQQKIQLFSMGQAQLYVNNAGHECLLYTAYVHGLYRLGLIYCHQRPSEIHCIDITSICTALHQLQELSVVTDDNITSNNTTSTTISTLIDALNNISQQRRIVGPPVSMNDLKSGSARSPRISPDASKIVFLYTPFVETHSSPTTLMISNDDGEHCSTLVDLVPNATKNDWPGLYTTDLPTPAFTIDSTCVVLNTNWGFQTYIAKINCNSGEIMMFPSTLKSTTTSSSSSSPSSTKRLKPITNNDNTSYSTSLLCLSPVDPNLALVVISSFTIPGDVMWLNLNTGTFINETNPLFSLAPHIKDFKSEFIQHNLITTSSNTSTSTSTTEDKYYESMLFVPQNTTNNNKSPLIVFVHGGPHASFTDTFSPETAFFMKETKDYFVLLINYRGSTGLSQQSLNSLPGNIGINDVQDVYRATMQVLNEKSNVLDINKVGIMGGSHGGFLTAHAIGQYPTLFKAAVMRNPVTDLSTMVSTTDIMDWCKVETFGAGKISPIDYLLPPTMEELVKLRQQSPIAHVDKVTASTLLLLGMVDRRVPPSQGLSYGKALKALNRAQVQIFRFAEDHHALDKPQTTAIWIEETVKWFKSKLF
jgi:acylaminoacyl-peptidase